MPLRTDFSAGELRQLAKRAKSADQSRRLLLLAAVLDGMSRKAAAEIGAMDRQTLRDWAHRFNAKGPEGLINGKAPGPVPKPWSIGDRCGSVRDTKPCPQRRQLSTEAVAMRGDGCAANTFNRTCYWWCNPIADIGAGDRGICNGPTRDSCTAKKQTPGRPNNTLAGRATRC